jgi:hypothetical protein
MTAETFERVEKKIKEAIKRLQPIMSGKEQ